MIILHRYYSVKNTQITRYEPTSRCENMRRHTINMTVGRAASTSNTHDTM